MLRYVIGISLVTLVVLILRILTNGKVLKRYQYAVWLIIPIYMIVSPFLRINVPVAEGLADRIPLKQEVVATESFREKGEMTLIGEAQKRTAQKIEDQAVLIGESKDHSEIDYAYAIKVIGLSVSALIIVALAVYNLGFVIYCKGRRKFIGKDPRSGLEIYRIGYNGTPFLLFNKIYVSCESDADNRYIIGHEVCHYKHGDSWWVILRYLVLALNWYNPFIWTAFFLSGQDCELACDEEVLRLFGEDSSVDYAKTIFEILQQRSNSSFGFTLSTRMRGEFKMVKSRILNIKKPTKQNYKALALSVATLLVFTGCTVMEPTATRSQETLPSVSIEKLSTDTPIEKSITKVPTEEPEGSSMSGLEQMEDGLYTVAMAPVMIDNEDGSVSYFVYPWIQYEVDQDYIDALSAGGTLALPDDLEIESDLINATIKDVEFQTVDAVMSDYKYLTEYTGDRVHVVFDEERGINFRKTVDGTWVLWEYDMPVFTVYEPVEVKTSSSVTVYDAYHFVEDGGTEGMTPEQMADVLQFKDTSKTKNYVDGVDAFFIRGFNYIAGEENSFDELGVIGVHTLTLIRVENGAVSEVYFYA